MYFNPLRSPASRHKRKKKTSKGEKAQNRERPTGVDAGGAGDQGSPATLHPPRKAARSCDKTDVRIRFKRPFSEEIGRQHKFVKRNMHKVGKYHTVKPAIFTN